jgi:hypothetical protein
LEILQILSIGIPLILTILSHTEGEREKIKMRKLGFWAALVNRNSGKQHMPTFVFFLWVRSAGPKKVMILQRGK